jgi:hypothetical protein
MTIAHDIDWPAVLADRLTARGSFIAGEFRRAKRRYCFRGTAPQRTG